ncbi:MAG: hypothetical protein ABW171_12665 [Steroidobacter sp.]
MSKALNRILAVPLCCVSLLSIAHATSHESIEGTWCNQDSNSGETIVQYFISGSQVTALTVLSEADPRLIGSQASLPLDQARSLTSGSYKKCDSRQAWARAQAFMSSPAAEEATRKALHAEQLQREDAEMEQRRTAERDAYFADIIHQLSLARRYL